MFLSSKSLGLAVALAVASVTFVPAPAVAQYYQGGGVANVSVANGYVTLVRADSGVQTAATINAPVMPGDYVATNSGAYAEVQFDGISSLRIAPYSQVRFISLNAGNREVQVGSGTVDLYEAQGNNGGAQIDTPSLTVRPNQSGDYRVSVVGNGQTLVTVRSGSATISTGQGSQTLTPGTTLVAYGDYNNPQIQAQGAIGYDAFDQFNQQRDQTMYTAYNANPYLSPQLAGYSNFSNYGQWQNVPGYGYAWSPNNQSNFAPYQNGQWTWEPGYGYTWVPSEQWGYAPSHYGRWFFNNNYGGWLWQPPAYEQQTSQLGSSWLPALVAFFLGGGNNNNMLGWVPLAPGEQYQPWYGGSSYNPVYPPTSVAPVTNIYNYYGNARYAGGVTMIPVSAFRAGNYRSIIRRPQSVSQVRLIRGAIPVVPTTSMLHVAPVAPRPVQLVHTFAAPRFAAKAPNAAHLSFATQQARMQTIVHRKPPVVAAPAHVAVTPSVYHPAPHPSMHPIVIERPVQHAAPPATHNNAAPPEARAVQPRQHATPQMTHAAPPQQHATPPQQHVVPQVTHTVAPEVRTAAPAQQRAIPQVTHTVPPEVHTARPVERAVPPVQHAPPPVVHTVPPQVRTAPPVERAAPPVQHVAPPPQAVAPPVQHVAPPPQQHVAPPPQHPTTATKPPASEHEPKPRPAATPHAHEPNVRMFSE